MFNNSSNIDASHSTFSEVHRDQYIYSNSHVQGNYTANTVVHGNQVFQSSLGLENLYRTSVPSAAFDSFDRQPAASCLPGTRLELLSRLVEWIDNPNSNQRLCWLSGPAGSGKSAIAQSIAEKYANLRRLAASFFFSRKEILRRKAQGFFPTLACQALVFSPSIKPALLGALDTDPTIPNKVLLEQARRLLEQPIVTSTTTFSNPILIVVDSLDECDDMKMATEIVHLLHDILCRCHWPLKVLFTSRAEPHLVQTFQHKNLRPVTYSFQLQEFGVDDDIRAYLRHSFKGIRESMGAFAVDDLPASWPPEDDVELIVQKAAGLFIFATTVIKYVSMDYGSPMKHLRAVLQVLQNSAGAESALVHSPLDSLYLDVLRTIQDEEKVRLVLGSIVFAFRPLSARGLNDLLWKFKFDTFSIIKSLFSVLVVPSSDVESDGAVRIYHTSFRDFLTSPSRSRQYFVDASLSHSILARACLELMIQHLKFDMCGIGDPSVPNCDIGDLSGRCKLHINEGVRYACRWFSHHLSQVPWSQTTDRLLVLALQQFSDRHLLNWIEVLSLIGELDSAVLSLREVADWLKQSQSSFEETLSLFHDAERLILMCYDCVQKTALQVYYCLPFVPKDTQIRTTYAHELNNKFVVTRGLVDHWKYCLRSVSTGGKIESLAVSASGRLIASAGDTSGVQLWDVLIGSNTGHFVGDGVSTCPVVFSPSGDYVAIGYDTGAIDVWDVSTGQRLLDPGKSPHTASVKVLVFSWNGLFIASGAEDGTVHVWDVSNGTLRHSVSHHEGAIRCLIVSFNDDLLASGSDDKSIVTSDVQSGQLLRRFQGHASKVNSISFSPSGETIASGSDDQSVRLWDTRSGVCIRTFTGVHKKPVCQVWITADNEYIFSACSMNIYMWKISSSSRRSPQHIWSINRYYRKLATALPAWYAKLARFLPSRLIGSLMDTDGDMVLHTASSSDGKTIACAYDFSLFLLECSAHKTSWSSLHRHGPLATPSTVDEAPLFAGQNAFTSIAMTPDKTVLVTSADNGDISIWNTSAKNDWKALRNSVKDIVDDFWPAPDGHSLLVKSLTGLQLIMPSGALIKDLETGGDMFGDVGGVPSPDSKYFAYWAEYVWNLDRSFSIYIYDSSNGVRLKRIPEFFNITCCRFSVESDFFTCAHGDGIVQVWELPSVLCKTTITTGHATITAVEFLPGNTTLLVGSDKGCVEIRMVEDGDIVHHVDCSSSRVSALAVPTSALIVIIGHADGSMFVWDPSYINVAPHCLSFKASDKTSDDPNNESDDMINFIKFTEGYRSICSRNQKGVVCTWDLTHCLEEYAGRGNETEVEKAVDDTVTCNVSVQPTDQLPSSDETKSTASVDSELTTTDVPETSPPTTRCPHLISRSDSDIVYDRYLRSAYSVDTQQGWVYRGSKRMFWLPSDLRPSSLNALLVFEDQLFISTRSESTVFLDLRPMI